MVPIISVPSRRHLNGVVSVSLRTLVSASVKLQTRPLPPGSPSRRSVPLSAIPTPRGGRWGPSSGPLCSRSADQMSTSSTPFPSKLRTPHSRSRATSIPECDESKKSNSDCDNPLSPSFYFPNSGDTDLIGVTSRRFCSNNVDSGLQSESGSRGIKCLDHAAFPFSTTRPFPHSLSSYISYLHSPAHRLMALPNSRFPSHSNGPSHRGPCASRSICLSSVPC